MNDVASIISNIVADDANIIFGSSVDETYGDEMAVTVVATSFERFEEQEQTQAFRVPPPPPAPPAPRREPLAYREPPPPPAYREPPPESNKRPRKFWSRF